MCVFKKANPKQVEFNICGEVTSLTSLPPGISVFLPQPFNNVDHVVSVYRGVMSKSGQLVQCEHFVKLTTNQQVLKSVIL